ncbi:MAG: MarR family transcriptional regulator [Nitrospirae bacterium]|nr:MarR family transcriptional regulator [Nitrospirota bacterium]
MEFENKAHELIMHIQIIRDSFFIIDKRNPAVCKVLGTHEATVLFNIGFEGLPAMSEIAEKMSLRLSSISWVVNKLEDKKFVRRVRSDINRRIVRVELTDSGKEIFKVVQGCYMHVSRTILQALNPEEQDVLINLFRKISNKFNG